MDLETALPLAAVAGVRPDEDLLDGGLTTFSFSSTVGSAVDPRFRFAGSVSIASGSMDARVEREDRLGGIASVVKETGNG